MTSQKPSVRLTFYGATKTVTGSKYLIEVDQSQVLIDCGLFQGAKKLRSQNWENPPFDPTKISSIVLTHAHIDHTGYLPLVVKRGFRGSVYCTAATKELLGILLMDSAYLQEEQARYHNKHSTSKHKPAKPLYDQGDAREAIRRLVVLPRDVFTEVAPMVKVKPTCAGHILGSTSLTVECGSKRICFSGDVGRYETPILPDPVPLDQGDLLLCESTYGDRIHSEESIAQGIAQVIRLAVERKGPIIIPAFAVGRTQTLLYYLAELERAGDIPQLPVFIDSPMAVNTTEIYRRFRHDYDEDAKELLSAGEYPLSTLRTKLCPKVEDSKRLNYLRGSRIIISASGMITGGRILHHMRQWLPQEETTVVFVGYQAHGTRGRDIQKGADEVKIFGSYIPVRANIETVSGLSAHADYIELLRWLKKSNGSPSQVKIVHGESDAADTFARRIRGSLGWNTSVAEFGETVEL